MSYANGTTNYNLPQTVGTDKRDWSDTNAAFAAVDAALKSAVDGVATDAAAITDIQADLNTPTTGIKARLTAVEDTNTSQGSAIGTLQETVLLQGGSITNLQTAVAATAKASAIAEPYSDASTYAVGDVVMYQGARYVCTTAIETAEDFDATHWAAEDVQEALENAELQLVKTVTCDGVKTYAEILATFATDFTALSDSRKNRAILTRGTNVFHVGIGGTVGDFMFVSGTPSSMNFETLRFSTGAIHKISIAYADGAITHTDESSTVPSEGSIISLFA